MQESALTKIPNNIEPLVADLSKQEELKATWPYTDFEFDEWIANGALLTEKGVPSRLEIKEYNLVRTPEFKTWFGDWANPEVNKASDIVDSASDEPTVWYRGDSSFHKDEYVIASDKNRGDTGEVAGHNVYHPRNQGIFFSNNRDVSMGYALDSSPGLGKHEVHPELDHQRTFDELMSHLISNANTDPYFWNKTIDVYFRRDAISDSEYEIRFRDYFKNIFNGEDADSLWNEIIYNRRTKSPKYFLDILSKHRYVFSHSVLEPLKVQYFRKPEGFNFKPVVEKQYNSNFSHSRDDRAPVDIQILRELIIKYEADPVCLRKVFIRSSKTKIGQSSQDAPDIFKARKEGYDSYINKNAVGGHKYDEVIVFDASNIWIADTIDLSEEYLKKNI